MDNVDNIIESVAPSRRSFLKKVVVGAVAVPVVTSFGMSGFGLNTASAIGSNGSFGSNITEL